MFRQPLVRSAVLFLFSHRTLALLRWDLHFLWIRFKNLLLGKHAQLRRSLAARPRPIYLNLGSGPRGLADPHWINVDGYASTNVHFCLDFARRLPFPDGCVDGIFCEHVLEHFTLQEGLALLQECWRVLRYGQCLRIIVPDGEKIMRTYCSEPAELLARRRTATACAMEEVNFYFRQVYEHQCMYDWELLCRQLSQAGFSNIARESFMSAKQSTAILLDDKAYEWESLYVEAVKPAQGASK